MTLFRCLKSASVSPYSLSSNSGFKVEILDWGASINSVLLDFANSVLSSATLVTQFFQDFLGLRGDGVAGLDFVALVEDGLLLDRS